MTHPQGSAENLTNLHCINRFLCTHPRPNIGGVSVAPGAPLRQDSRPAESGTRLVPNFVRDGERQPKCQRGETSAGSRSRFRIVTTLIPIVTQI